MKFCSQSCAARYNNNIRDSRVHHKQSQTLRNTLIDRGLARTDQKEIYKIACNFKFNIYQYPSIPGFELLLERGIHNHQTNNNGVVRDHIVSKEYGWQNQIPVAIINHPANCQFITNLENVQKGADSHLSYQQLLDRIRDWEIDHKIEGQELSKNIIKVSQKSKKISTKRHKPRKSSKNRHPEKYQWTLQHSVTLQVEITTQITKWLKEKHLSTSAIYGRTPKWVILKKTNIRTGEIYQDSLVAAEGFEPSLNGF